MEGGEVDEETGDEERWDALVAVVGVGKGCCVGVLEAADAGANGCALDSLAGFGVVDVCMRVVSGHSGRKS